MNTSLKVKDFKAEALSMLSKVYGDREARWIVRALLEDVMGWNSTDLVLKDDYEFLPHTYHKLLEMASRVASGEPVQYVTGCAPFYGMTFHVTPSVLIPRPETAQLVDFIIADYSSRQDLQVLDCGTGSGCIAIALARNLPFSQVTAIDISADALTVARANAHDLKVRINFEQQDILTLPGILQDSTYDIIVSNPPYIADSERRDMSDNVLLHEPHQALFVPDDDPVKFYRAIAQYALTALKDGGRLYFEINPLYVKETKNLLTEFDDVTVQRDNQGRERFIIATKHQ